ncbi:PREDICTED: uncharacterized protein LOC108364823 [Rhagoletis zephyria]|uniref:uncharacterized protein LOC108364823 n=1 Tax=Rhagoletis zephyria TaxID=28612 RepID=UPI000811A0CB|nr:PREDICTED: uncharacterized protein LOC108364823 [Rhagoletis zephyria]
MLHDYFSLNPATGNTRPVSAHHVTQTQHKCSLPQVVLGTALVEVRFERGHTTVLRALLDSGAEAAFVSINGASGSGVATVKGLVSFTLHSLKNNVNKPCTALVLPWVGNITPTLRIGASGLQHFSDLDLADPKLTIPQSIDMILNAEIYAEVLLSGIRRSRTNNLIAQNTQLGWIEELNTVACYTEDERYVEEYFQNTTRRRKDGRYIVRLPVKRDEDLRQLIPTQRDAVVLHEHLQRRLSRNAILQTMYTDFLDDYLSQQHMQLINNDTSCTSPVYYLPHHGVWKASSSTTKLRVVFNAPKRCSAGKSLNDCLYNDLTAVVLNWRRYRVALTGDITKMYRQILVDERDADLQRIVWSPAGQENLSHYRLNTVTYGTNCTPYLAIKVLHTLAAYEQDNFPDAGKILIHEFYVDDVLTVADSVADACKRRDELQTLLQAAGFTLRKWNSISTETIQTIEPTYLELKASHEFQVDDHANTLVWATKSDCLTYSIKIDYTITIFTKRQLLSDVARLFDPLGFLAPIIIRGKIFIQKFWLTGLQWNEILPDDLKATWLAFRSELKLVPEIQVPRWIHITNEVDSYEFHASTHAYAAVVYLKVVAKGSVKTTLNLDSATTYFWSDSTTTIWWIRSDPGALKELVSNRVSQIQALTAVSNWRYVRTADNPADCASRGSTIQQLMRHPLWWNGPE